MIHHYVNLVCWRGILEVYDPSRDQIWVDSVSLLRFATTKRTDVAYRPGTTVLADISFDELNCGSWFFLTAAPLLRISSNVQFELPFFEDASVAGELEGLMHELVPGTRVAIGVSSPKQNHLAIALHQLRPDLEFHCLGAAVAEIDAALHACKGRKSVLSGSGLEWLRFLLVSPRRTFIKIGITVWESLLLLVHKDSREAFGRFVAICASAAETAADEESGMYRRG